MASNPRKATKRSILCANWSANGSGLLRPSCCVFRSKIATASGRNLPSIPVEGCHCFRLKAATASGRNLPPQPGVLEHMRRRHNPIGIVHLSHLAEGGADASTEVIDASSARSLTASMGLWSERLQDCRKLTGQSTHGGRLRAAGAGGRAVLAPAGYPRRYRLGETAVCDGCPQPYREAPSPQLAPRSPGAQTQGGHLALVVARRQGQYPRWPPIQSVL